MCPLMWPQCEIFADFPINNSEHIGEAIQYQRRHRHIVPQLYNPRRLMERQFRPSAGQHVDNFIYGNRRGLTQNRSRSRLINSARNSGNIFAQAF